MAIQDLAGNPIATGAAGQMIGYIEPPAPEEVLPLDMYRFLLEPIRQEDAKREGAFFVKRYLQGPQAIWLQTQESIFNIKKLWSITECPDEFLKYLKNIVGWTNDLNYITEALSNDALRRLIAASIPLWKKRGREQALLDVLRLATGTRCRIWNWFDYRWVLDETNLGEQHEGRDPWIIELPGPPTLTEYYSTLRIVDDGSLNRELVANLVQFMRPVGERVEVAYIDFLDQFLVDDDLSQWQTLQGSEYLTVAEGQGQLLDTSQIESVITSRTDAFQWHDCVTYWRIKLSGTDCGCLFYVQDASNYYFASIRPDINAIELGKKVGGTTSTIASWTPPSPAGPILDEIWYGIRVEIVTEGATNRIKVFFDGDEIINTTDPDLSQGNIGLYHAAGSTAKLDEIEMFQLPLDTELVDINS